ncbi:MAG: ATP-binding protein [Vulcanimicrobiota bacterium]
MEQLVASGNLTLLEEVLGIAPDPCLIFSSQGEALCWSEQAARLLGLGDCLRPYRFAQALIGGVFAPPAIKARFRSAGVSSQRSRIQLDSRHIEVLWRVCDFRGRRLLFAYLRRLDPDFSKQRHPLFSTLTMHRILESLPVAIVTYSLEGLITYYNQAAQRLYGWEETAKVGRPSPFPIPSQDLFPMLESMNSDSPPLELCCRRPGPDKEMEVRLTVSPWINPNGYLQGYLEITEDLTQIRSQERQLETSRRALVQMQKMEAVGRLAGAMAHDFNNLLVVVRCNSELQMASNRVETELMQEILEAGSRGQELTQKLLTFARSSNRAYERFPLCQKLAMFKSLLSRAVRSRQCKLNFTIEPGLSPILVQGDVSQLENVFMNLVMNAADASGEGQQIDFELSRREFQSDYLYRTGKLGPGSYAQISVRDRGCGMSAEQLDHLFEPFFTTKPEGNGLGLASAYGVIAEHGGGIEVESQLQKGTTMRIFLPALDYVCEPSDAEPVALTSQQQSRVLLIEDLEHIRKLVTRILTKQGYQVVALATAEEAERFLEEATPLTLPTLVMSDVSLPGRNGLELAREVKQRFKIPVLLTSGYTSENACQEFAFLPKPFSPQELAGAIEKLKRDPQSF